MQERLLGTLEMYCKEGNKANTIGELTGDKDNKINKDLRTELTSIQNKKTDGKWRVRMAIYQLLGELAIIFGYESYQISI